MPTQTPAPPRTDADRLAQLDHAHLWHPFTPMKQWRHAPPLIIERADGCELIDADGRRYIDGVSSLWCNVHGHRNPYIDQAVRNQLDQVAHTTLLGLASPPSIELAARLATMAPGELNKVFYSDAGATAVEVAFKMAVGYWHHVGRGKKNKFIGVRGAYHGDTTGAMSVGYSPLFHRPFLSMVFETLWTPAPGGAPAPGIIDHRLAAPTDHPSFNVWPSEDAPRNEAIKQHGLAELETLLHQHADEVAAIVIEPIMQGAAGMICQPPGYLQGVAQLAKQYNVLLIADEVAVGFGRTGKMFACEQEDVSPDLMCLAKGITGGYLPLAATLCTNEIEQAFCGELAENKTLYHGHTYTGNALACAAANASLDLFEKNDLLSHIQQSAAIIKTRLDVLRDNPHVLDVRQRGIMVGVELCRDRATAALFDPADRTAYQLCAKMRDQGLILRPLGDVLVLMPIPAMGHDLLHRMLDIVIDTVQELPAA